MLQSALLRKLIAQSTAQAQKHEKTRVNTDGINVNAQVAGFIDKDTGDLLRVPPTQKLNAKKTSVKVRFCITDLSHLKPIEGQIRKAEQFDGFEIKVSVEVTPAAMAYYRGENASEEQLLEAKKELDEKTKGMTDDERIAFFKDEKKKIAKFRPTTIIWQPLYVGKVIEINIFTASQIAGVSEGSNVTLEGMYAAGKILKFPKKKTQTRDPPPMLCVFLNVKNVIPTSHNKNKQKVLAKLATYERITIHPNYADVEIDVTEATDKERQVQVIPNFETKSYTIIPLKLEFQELRSTCGTAFSKHATLCPSREVDDFQSPSKTTDEERKKNREANPNILEEEESTYISLISRTSLVLFKDDIEKEMEIDFVQSQFPLLMGARQTQQYNIVVKTGSQLLKREYGMTRSRIFTPIMEACIQSIDMTICGQFLARETKDNYYNQTIEETSINNGSVFFQARVLASNFEEFLLTKTFHPTTAWLDAHFKEHIDEDRGYMYLKTLDPYTETNPLLDRNGKISDNMIDVVPLSNMNGMADCYRKPEKYTICVMTSMWFAKESKLEYTGICEQDAQLALASSLTPTEADNALKGEAEGKLYVHPTSKLFVYAVRNKTGEKKVFTSAAAATPIVSPPQIKTKEVSVVNVGNGSGANAMDIDDIMLSITATPIEPPVESQIEASVAIPPPKSKKRKKKKNTKN